MPGFSPHRQGGRGPGAARAFGVVGSLRWCVAGLLLPACSPYMPDLDLRSEVERADYAGARAKLEANLAREGSRQREFVLDSMRLGMVNLAAGAPGAAEPAFFQTFMTLRRQGINDDQTVAASFFGEGGTIFWKGEPFEQALAFTYVATTYAELGQWDNARAAAQASLFQLKSFGDAERAPGKGAPRTKEEVAAEALRREQRRAGSFEDYIDHGYTPTRTDFALGYLLSGVANQALAPADPDRAAEAQDNLREAFTLLPPLREVADRLISGRCNAVLVVDYGAGPQKIRYGPDGALTRFEARTPSDGRRLSVRVGAGQAEVFPWACDINRMSQDLMWNSFEDVRRAKSFIGDLLVTGGLITAGTGLGRNTSKERTQQGLAGLGIALAGAALKASAAADLRFNEILPQRVYVAPVFIPSAGTPVVIAVEGDPGSGVMIADLPPPEAPDTLRLRYVRIPVRQSFAAPAGPG